MSFKKRLMGPSAVGEIIETIIWSRGDRFIYEVSFKWVCRVCWIRSYSMNQINIIIDVCATCVQHNYTFGFGPVHSFCTVTFHYNKLPPDYY